MRRNGVLLGQDVGTHVCTPMPKGYSIEWDLEFGAWYVFLGLGDISTKYIPHRVCKWCGDILPANGPPTFSGTCKACGMVVGGYCDPMGEDGKYWPLLPSGCCVEECEEYLEELKNEPDNGGIPWA